MPKNSSMEIPRFLLTPPRRGRSMFHCNFIYFFIIISTHAPAWGRPVNPLDVNCAEYFYSRPHVGGDAIIGNNISHNLSQFLLTPPHGGRPALLTHLRKSCYFYSRPREGGDTAGNHGYEAGRAISTHAPAWGRPK